MPRNNHAFPNTNRFTRCSFDDSPLAHASVTSWLICVCATIQRKPIAARVIVFTVPLHLWLLFPGVICLISCLGLSYGAFPFYFALLTRYYFPCSWYVLRSGFFPYLCRTYSVITLTLLPYHVSKLPPHQLTYLLCSETI